MEHSKHHHNEFGRPSSDSTIEAHRPRWKTIHHDWRFWVFLILMVIAMVIYIASEDLSVGPRGRQHQPVPENVAP